MTDSTDNARGPERFAEWFRKSYPGPDTIIHKPDWHAPKIYRAAIAAARADLAPDPLGAVKVKPLEWKAHNEVGHGRSHYGSGAFGHWYAVSRAGRGAWDCMTHIGGKRFHLGYHPTIEAAKAAAQADYETRIRSALEPDPQDARVARMLDALRYYADPKTYAPDKRYANEPWPIFDDEGALARAALAAFDKGGKDE